MNRNDEGSGAVDRRELFVILGVGVISPSALSAQHSHAASGGQATVLAGPYPPRAVNSDQYETLGKMLEILLPADESSPSAREAGIDRYLDTVLHYSGETVRAQWRSGLDAIAGQFAANPDHVAVLTRVAEREQQPRDDAERFFVVFKQAAVAAYYMSDGGRKALGYRGDTAIREFVGCTHASHHLG